MAHDIKSPGSSVQVMDNTQFTATSTGTLAAAVGFAEKGPIGVPTLILGKEDYINTFGKPVEDNPFMGMFADKFLDISTGYFTRIGKENEYEKVVGSVPPSLNFSSVATPEFWIKLQNFPEPNNGIFRVTFAGSITYTTLDDLVAAINTGLDNVTLPDGTTKLSSLLTVEAEGTALAIRSDVYRNVVITILSSQTADNVAKVTGTGHIGIANGSVSTDTGSYAYAYAKIPVNPVPATGASLSSAAAINQPALNMISAFNLLNLKVDGNTDSPFKNYTNLDITPTVGAPAGFPVLGSPNSPLLNVNWTGADLKITLAGFYDFASGNASADVNKSFTFTPTLNGSVSAFTLADLVTDLNDRLAATAIGTHNLREYVQFEVYQTNRIRVINGTLGLKNFGSQCSVAIEDGVTGRISDLGYVSPIATALGTDSTYTLAGVAEKLNTLVPEVTFTASAGILTMATKTTGGTSFIEIGAPAAGSAVTLLGFTADQNNTGTNASNSGIYNIVYKTPGTAGNRVKVRTYTTVSPITGDTVYNLDVYEGDNRVESFANVNWTNPASDRFVKKVVEKSAYIAIDFGETLQYPSPDTVDAPTLPPPSNGEAGTPEYWALENGNNGIPTDGAEIDALAIEALDEYNDEERYLIDVLLAPGFTGAGVVTKLVGVGEARRDIVVLPDCPPFLTWKEVIDWHNGAYPGSSAINSQFAIVTWDWQKDFDPYNANYVDLPPSIYMAVALAKTQKNANVWEAPAGPINGVVNSISSYSKPKKAEREYLNNDVDFACINPIVTFPGEGTMIYGQKTCLRSTKAQSRINVVRSVNTIKRNLERIGRKFAFRLTNESTWSDITRDLNSYLGNIKEKGGLYSFGVQFDGDTNTGDLQDQGIMYGKVFIQPVKVGERIFIDLTIQNTGAKATEA